MSSSRILAGAAAGLFALALGIAPAVAQDYPARPITVIVPFAAGGPTDVVARIVGDHMSRTLGQTLVIENVVGAGGTTGITRAMRAKTDGYTIIMGHHGHPCGRGRRSIRTLPYDPANDFEPIGMAAGTPILILAKKDFPPKDLKEFVDLREGERDEAQHGACRRRLGVVHHLPAAELDPGGEADLDPVPRHRPGDECAGRRPGRLHVRPDRQRGAAGPGRHHQGLCDRHRRNAIPSLPNVPTTKEAGLPEFQASAWNALFAPKGTPKPIIDKLSAALDKALDDEATRKRLLDLGSDIPGRIGAAGRPWRRWSRARSPSGRRSSRRPAPELKPHGTC